MILQTIQEIEDIYMKFRQSLTFDKSFNTVIVDQLGEVEYIEDQSQNRTKFSCKINNYIVRGYLDSSKVVLECERRYNKQNVEDFLKRVYEF